MEAFFADLRGLWKRFNETQMFENERFAFINGSGQKRYCAMTEEPLGVVMFKQPSQLRAYIEADDPTGTGSVKGWVAAEFLSKKDPGDWKGNVQPDPVVEDQLVTLSAVCAKIKPVAVPYAAEIKTKNPTALVHLRWFPNTSARFVDAFPRGTAVTVIAKSSKWTQVMYTPADTDEVHVGFVLTDNVQEY